MDKYFKQHELSHELAKAAEATGISQTAAEKHAKGTHHLQGKQLSAFVQALGGQAMATHFCKEFRSPAQPAP